jgi:hypothetical protein
VQRLLLALAVRWKAKDSRKISEVKEPWAKPGDFRNVVDSPGLRKLTAWFFLEPERNRR